MASPRNGRLGSRSTRAGFWRRWTIPIIGSITPVGLIVVNVAAFIVHHLAEFRLIITIGAFVSTVLLGSWQAVKFYRLMKQRAPQVSLVDETNEDLVLVGGMTFVILVSVLAAYLCYIGLSDERNLPNVGTFLGGAIGIALPVILQVFFRRTLHTDRRAAE